MHRAATADLTVTVLYLRLFFLRLRTLRVTQRSIRNTWRACGNSARTLFRGVHHPGGALLGAAVPGPGGLVADGDGGPVQGIDGAEEPGGAALDGHDVAGEQVLADERGAGADGVAGVDGDHVPGQGDALVQVAQAAARARAPRWSWGR